MYFAEPVLHEIPVRPRVKKFIQAKLRDEQGRPQPMLVEAGPLGLGLNLWGLCQSEKVRLVADWRRRAAQPNQANYLLTDGAGRMMAPPDMTEKIGVAIGEFHKSRCQYLLNYAELETFSAWVDYMILNELVIFCETNTDLPIIARIRQFCDQYDFSSDDLNEESLRVHYWRYQAKKDNSHNYHVELTRQVHFRPYAMQQAA